MLLTLIQNEYVAKILYNSLISESIGKMLQPVQIKIWLTEIYIVYRKWSLCISINRYQFFLLFNFHTYRVLKWLGQSIKGK